MMRAGSVAGGVVVALPYRACAPYEGAMDGSGPQPHAAPSGLTRLLAEMRPQLERFMRARGCEANEVDDLVQDLFVKVEELRSGPVANPRAYVFRIAANLVLDARRGRRRQQSRDDGWARARYGAELESAPDPSPEDIAVSRDLFARVEAALGAMPQRTAEILRLYRLEGLPQKAIAERFGLSLSAVEKHLQRAYRALAGVRSAFEAEPEWTQREGTDG
jgi:RNA polymerase sigma-70 factor (ECF subfamily)